MKIPIIILNWNGASDTLECLDSLERQTYLKHIVVYLVDNGSEEKDRAKLLKISSEKEWIHLILNRENLGFTKGNNEVLRKYILPNPDYKQVILLNNDTIQDKNWVAQLVESAKSNEAHIVSSKMINYFDRAKMDNAGHQMLNTGEIIPIGHDEPIIKYSEVSENVGACAGAALYDLGMLRRIGILDEYFTTGYEDAEIGLRANVLGFKTIFEPKAIVYHKISQSVAKIRNFDYTQQIQVNIYYSYFKLMPLGVILLNLPFLLFKFFAVSFVHLVFLRKDFLKVFLSANYRIFVKEWKAIMTSRKNFQKQQTPVTTYQIMKKLRFFLWFDIKRFYTYIIMRQKTTFENW